MNYQELENKELNECAYVLKGDPYLISECVKKIAKKLNVQQINISKFDGDNFDGLSITNACNQFSFFAEKRIVCVSMLDKELTANDKKIIASYVSSPNKDCCLLIENNSGFFDFLKDVKTIECTISESGACTYIINAFKNRNKVISSELAKTLYSYTLGNFNRLKLEIQKVCDYLGARDEVTEQDINTLVYKDSELKVFDLTVALSEKNRAKAHQVLYDMLKSGEPPIRILGLISNHFRRLFFAKINKGSSAELAKAMGCKEYAITKAKQQAQWFGASSLKNIQNLILETDYNIKSGVMTQENALYYLIFAIMGA